MKFEENMKNSSNPPRGFYYHNFTSYEEIKKSILRVNVYYDKISYISATDVSVKGIGQVFSEIGGLIGLCLGASILSMLDLVEFLIKSIFIILSK